MNATEISKYEKRSTAWLKKKAQEVFNRWIRERDKNLPCINCGKFTTLQAGHFYPTSTFGHLRFNEDNVNGECVSCNYFNSQSHSYGYRPNLIKKIGQERFDKLEQLANIKQYNKLDRFYLIEILNRYK
jgi:5-methylcytosine-specific restriction endonuclease McrA